MKTLLLVSLLLYNGKIWTENPKAPQAEAVALNGGHIVAVGTNAEILKLEEPETKLIDLGGRRMLPGFNDAHVHFYEGGSSLAGPQFRYAKSKQEFRDTLAEYVKHKPRGSGFMAETGITKTGVPKLSHARIDRRRDAAKSRIHQPAGRPHVACEFARAAARRASTRTRRTYPAA